MDHFSLNIGGRALPAVIPEGGSQEIWDIVFIIFST